MIKEIIGSVAVVLALVASNIFSFRTGHDVGVDAYHKHCYEVGGMVVDEESGTVVQCKPLTVIPQEERPMFKST